MPTTNRKRECEKGRCSPDIYVWTDPSLPRTTPGIWACGRCGREARWRRIRGRLIFIDQAPPVQHFLPAISIHSHITQANRRRAMHGLPSWMSRLV